jgi:hypothetical protein
MTRAARFMCGIILIVVPTIEFGGVFLLKSLSNPASGYLANPMREDLMRAGHAHAGVIILLSLIAQLLADGARAPAGFLWAVRIAFPCAAVLMSAGFFLSVTGAPSATQPGAMIGLVYVGGGVLAAAVVGLAVGLLRSLRNG